MSSFDECLSIPTASEAAMDWKSAQRKLNAAVENMMADDDHTHDPQSISVTFAMRPQHPANVAVHLNQQSKQEAHAVQDAVDLHFLESRYQRPLRLGLAPPLTSALPSQQHESLFADFHCAPSLSEKIGRLQRDTPVTSTSRTAENTRILNRREIDVPLWHKLPLNLLVANKIHEEEVEETT